LWLIILKGEMSWLIGSNVGLMEIELSSLFLCYLSKPFR
jgi:hypothetical protein